MARMTSNRTPVMPGIETQTHTLWHPSQDPISSLDLNMYYVFDHVTSMFAFFSAFLPGTVWKNHQVHFCGSSYLGNKKQLSKYTLMELRT